MKYEAMCNAILHAIGGSENIKDAIHCMTRLRISVKNTEKVNLEELKAIKGIMKVIVTNTQYQCVIGTEVNDVYPEFCKAANISEKAQAEEKTDVSKEKKALTPKGIFDAVIDAISGCVQPLLSGIICAGMLKLLVAVLGPSMLNLVKDGSDLLMVLTMASDVPFYFLPLMIGYTGAKKFGMNPVTGMILAALLMHPTYTGLVAAGQSFKVYGLTASLVDYSSSVVPMILVTWIGSYVEKFFKKIMPNMIKVMTVMPLTVLVMLPLEYCILAPLGNNAGQAIAGFIIAMPEYLGGIGIGLVGAIYIILVMTGMHLPLIMAISVTFFSMGHEDVVLATSIPACMACSSVCLGVWLKAKLAENKELGLSCFTSSILGGVNEPAIYGILLKYKKTFLFQIIGAFAASAIIGFTRTGYYTLTGGVGFLGFLAYSGASQANFIWGCIATAVALVVPVTLVLVFGFGEEKNGSHK